MKIFLSFIVWLRGSCVRPTLTSPHFQGLWVKGKQIRGKKCRPCHTGVGTRCEPGTGPLPVYPLLVTRTDPLAGSSKRHPHERQEQRARHVECGWRCVGAPMWVSCLPNYSPSRIYSYSPFFLVRRPPTRSHRHIHTYGMNSHSLSPSIFHPLLLLLYRLTHTR